MGLVKQDTDEDTLDEALRTGAKIEELPSDDSDDDFEDVDDDDAVTKEETLLPLSQDDLPLYLREAVLGLFHTDLETTTTEAQAKTNDECLPYLLGQKTDGLPTNSHGLPALRKTQHVAFLKAQVANLPAPYVAIDASRPWFFYWTMAGLSSLGEDVTSYRERLMDTVKPLQNKTGGFGGGHGQFSHCAGTYATVLALACVDGLEVVDRKAMWEWLGSMKQADGGFRMAQGAEEDIRGAYCGMTVLALLNLPIELPPSAPARKAGLKTFTDRLGEWVGRCQTYEGGIGGAPTNEAHGAYAFCALACLSIIDEPHASIPKYLDVTSLTHWLAARQTPSEGGFQGRQEKLVDACYSHWVGGCWDLLQAAIKGNKPPSVSSEVSADGDGSSPDLWNRAALIRYLLTCCQQPGAKKSGMRDKPSTRPDAYHTCYSLAGLSHAQNHYHYEGGNKGNAPQTNGCPTAGFRWSASRPSEQEMQEWKFDEQDRVQFVHPVFVVPMKVVEKTRLQFESARGGW